MKYIIPFLTIYFLFIFSNSYGQLTYNKVKYYNGDSSLNDAVIEGIVKLDTTYILVTTGKYDNKIFGMQVFKTDTYGNKIDSIRFKLDSIFYITYEGNCIVLDEDSNIIIASNFHNIHAAFFNIGEGYLIKLNKNLDTIWTRRLHLPPSLVGGCNRPNNHFTAVDCTPDSGYIVMGNYYKDCIYDNDNEHPYLTKYDKNGNMLWVKTYDNLYSAFDIAVTNDGGFVFTTSRSGYQNVYICKTDSIGNVIWYTKPSNETHHVSFDITVSGNYIYSIIPYVYYKVGNDLYSFKYGIEVNKIDSQTGQLIWSKKYIPLNSVRNPVVHQHHEVKVDNKGNIIIVGTGYAINPDSTIASYKGFILKLNNNGDSLWTHFYDWGNFFQRHAQFNAFVITDDGGILAGGFWNPPYLNYKQGAWLVKTDSMGNAPGMFTVGIEEKNTLIIKKQKPLLYPNPATDNFSLRFEQSPIEDYELSIYSSSGALVKRQQLIAFGNEYRVDIGELKSGVYFVRLESDGEIVFSSKFIKQ